MKFDIKKAQELLKKTETTEHSGVQCMDNSQIIPIGFTFLRKSLAD